MWTEEEGGIQPDDNRDGPRALVICNNFMNDYCLKREHIY